MAEIVIDARDAAQAELRGWGRYTRELVAAMIAEPPADFVLVPITGDFRGPELLFEQVRLPLLARRRRAALVHAPNCFLPLVRPCPGVVTINDLAFETWPEDFAATTRAKFRLITRLAARSADRIICPSRFTAEDVCTRYRVDPGKVRVIADAPGLALTPPSPPSPRETGSSEPEPEPGAAESDPGPAESEPGPADPEAARPYVLAVGDLRRKKNLGALVTAYADLRRDPGIPHRLVLAGLDSGEGPRLRELAGEASVTLTGYVSDERLGRLIAGAELLVHPSLYEGFGLVVLEAMARGTPVLLARATALPETGGDAADYFDPAEPHDLARRLEQLLADPARRSELSRRGRIRARQFSWARTARETAEVYRELL